MAKLRDEKPGNGKIKWQKISKKWLNSKKWNKKVQTYKTSIKGSAVGFEENSTAIPLL